VQQPYDRVREAGHTATILGSEAGRELTGKKGTSSCTVDTTVDQVDVGDFDALVIPGGYSPDKLRLNDDVVGFTRKMMESGQPVAAICHAGQLLVEAGVVEGRRMTSWPSVRTELELAGANWVDEEVVEDGNLITSRNPDDLPAFCEALLTRLS
jgi:protease I